MKTADSLRRHFERSDVFELSNTEYRWEWETRGKQWGEVAEHRRVSRRLRGQPPIKLHLSPRHQNSAHDHSQIRDQTLEFVVCVRCVWYRTSRKIHFLRPPLFHVSCLRHDQRIKQRGKETKSTVVIASVRIALVLPPNRERSPPDIVSVFRS